VDLAEQLGYELTAANRAQRVVHAVGTTRAGAWLLARTLPTLDAVLQRMTRDRQTLPELVAALPVINLTTTGRRSGLPRAARLIGIPFSEGLVVVGTNFGQQGTPAWALNLESDHRATVSYRAASVEVVARLLTGRERDEALAEAALIYAGYGVYQRRITGRRVRVFLLERPGSKG